MDIGTLWIWAIIWILIKYLLDKKKIKSENEYKRKFSTYTELINYSMPLLDNPSLSYDEAKQMTTSFLMKYHNEILPFAPKDIVENVDEFLSNSIVQVPEENELTKWIYKIISSIRKDIGLEKIDNIRFYAIKDEELQKKYNG